MNQNLFDILNRLGSSVPIPWLPTLSFAAVGLAVLLACSPLADWLATRLVRRPPTLAAFRAIQRSPGRLVLGILVAWLLGGILEETVFRGILLQSVAGWLSGPLGRYAALAVGILVAAVGASLFHFYQGLRGMLIIFQLSLLFGILFVLSGRNLWAVMLCHGLYDTIAFIRFALRKSRYSHLDKEQAVPS